MIVVTWRIRNRIFMVLSCKLENGMKDFKQLKNISNKSFIIPAHFYIVENVHYKENETQIHVLQLFLNI